MQTKLLVILHTEFMFWDNVLLVNNVKSTLQLRDTLCGGLKSRKAYVHPQETGLFSWEEQGSREPVLHEEQELSDHRARPTRSPETGKPVHMCNLQENNATRHPFPPSSPEDCPRLRTIPHPESGTSQTKRWVARYTVAAGRHQYLSQVLSAWHARHRVPRTPGGCAQWVMLRRKRGGRSQLVGTTVSFPWEVLRGRWWG